MPSEPAHARRVAIVTGAACGIGAAIAAALSAARMDLVLLDLDEANGRAVAEPLGATFRRLDVADVDGWTALCGFVEDRFGRLDVLVNNAGIYDPHPILEQDVSGFRHVVEVNQIGVFLGMQAAIPLMRKTGGGSIVNLSSTGGLRGFPGTLAYASTKWAVRGMTKVAAQELAADNIRVNSVHPGLSETRMAYENPPKLLEDLKQAIPAKRLGRPEEIAAVVAFLASEQSSYVSGAEIAVDGAATA